MAIDVTLNDVTSGFNLDKINQNFELIDTALQKALSRDGTTPNQMEADIDLNGYDLLNVGELSADSIVLDGNSLDTFLTLIQASEAAAADSADNAATSESNAASSASSVASSATSASNSASSASTSASAAYTSETNAAASASSAATSASNAATSETNAASSEASAATSETNAAASETAALGYKDEALGFRNEAEGFRDSASTSATNASASESKAQQWAQNPEDVPVEPGEYSAYHWAKKAEDNSGIYDPTNVSITGGTINNTSVGSTNPGTGAFTTLTASGTATFGTVDINGGAIDGTPIGANSADEGTFTKVGIGTSGTPLSALHIRGGATDTIRLDSDDGSKGYILKANVNNSNDYGFFIEDIAGVDLYSVIAGSSGYHSWFIDGVVEAHLTPTGLAIGKTSASEKLDVDGNAVISGTVTASNFNINGTNIRVDLAGDDFRIQSTTGSDMLQLIDAGASDGNAANPHVEFAWSTSLGSSATRLGYVGFGSSSNQDAYIVSDNGGIRLVPDTGHDVEIYGNLNASSYEVNAAVYKLGGAVLPVTKSFKSTEQTITSGGSLTLAHGLSVEPLFVTAELVCKTAELGFSINDVVQFPLSSEGASTASSGVSAKKDATNITIRFGSNSGALLVAHATTGVANYITNANWRLIVRAFA